MSFGQGPQHISPGSRAFQQLKNLFTQSKNRNVPHAHTNQHHTSGTAGFAHAPRHHGSISGRPTKRGTTG